MNRKIEVNTMNILFNITDNLYEPLLVCMNSIITNNSDEDLNFYLVHENVTDIHQENIRNFIEKRGKTFCSIHLEKAKLFPKYKDITIRLPLESYFYLFAIEWLDVDKVLYLDVDTFCVGSLKELWQMEFDDAYVMGKNVDARDTSYERAKASINPHGGVFINSGVVLMDLSKIRKLLKREHINSFLESYNDYHYWYADQIFINSYFEGRIKLLDEKYNRFCGDQGRMWQDEKEQAIIYHYAGSNSKPWHPYNENAYLYNLEDYYTYCNLEELSDSFKNRVFENIEKYKNNIWMVMRNRYYRRSAFISNEQIILDYSKQEIMRGGDIFSEFCEQNQYKRVALYGYTTMTKILLQKMQRKKVIDDICVIDRRPLEIQESVKVVQPVDFEKIEECFDVIIVTVVNDFYSICEYLKEVGITVPIRTLAEVIFSKRDYV